MAQTEDELPVYRVPASLRDFLTSEAFISLVTGPVGSGKTSAAVLKIAYHASRMKPQRDGVRRSRAVFIRNTNEQLRDTSLATFLSWFPDGAAGAYHKTEKRFSLRFNDVECDVLFRGLDDANDVRRLLSLEVSFAILDEFREINPAIFDAVQARVGRYPSVRDGGCVTDDNKPNKHIWGASNAPDADTFWEEYLTSPPSNAAVFMQPSARSPEADWLANLPPSYYDDIIEGKSEDWISVYVDNKFGRSLSGQPVFGRSFNSAIHVSQLPLNVVANGVIIGIDAGLTPAAVFAQVDYSGRLLVHDAIHVMEMGALRFVREHVKPLLTSKFAGRPCTVVIDPAAFQRAQTDERSVADIYKAEGFRVLPARTNAVAARIAAVENYLTRVVDGKPAFLISPHNTHTLVEAMRSKYRYRINTKGEREDSPEKNHPYSDLADCLQYVCLFADNGATFGAAMVQTRSKPVVPAKFAYV